MGRFKSWPESVSIIVSVLLSLLGMLTGKALAVSNTSTIEKTAAQETIAQTCPPYTKLQPYSRVTTRDGDPLNVRATPNGQVIGLIPNGWAVIPVQKDKSGNWIRITHHFGNFEPAFASAPDFKNGWVAARFLKPLGKFCEKPMMQSRILRGLLSGQRPIVMPTQLTQLGDRIARQR